MIEGPLEELIFMQEHDHITSCHQEKLSAHVGRRGVFAKFSGQLHSDLCEVGTTPESIDSLCRSESFGT